MSDLVREVRALGVAEVRQALMAIRRAWFSSFSPEMPLACSQEIFEHHPHLRTMTLTEFALGFELFNHIKRHQKSSVDANPAKRRRKGPSSVESASKAEEED